MTQNNETTVDIDETNPANPQFEEVYTLAAQLLARATHVEVQRLRFLVDNMASMDGEGNGLTFADIGEAFGGAVLDYQLRSIAHEFSERMASVQMTDERARIASNFYGFYQDGNDSAMLEALNDLDGTICMCIPDTGFPTKEGYHHPDCNLWDPKASGPEDTPATEAMRRRVGRVLDAAVETGNLLPGEANHVAGMLAMEVEVTKEFEDYTVPEKLLQAGPVKCVKCGTELTEPGQIASLDGEPGCWECFEKVLG